MKIPNVITWHHKFQTHRELQPLEWMLPSLGNIARPCVREIRSGGETEKGKEEIDHKIGSKAVTPQTSTKNTSVTVRVRGIASQQQASHLQIFSRNSSNQFSLTPLTWSQCQPQRLRAVSPSHSHMLWMPFMNPLLLTQPQKSMSSSRFYLFVPEAPRTQGNIYHISL